MIRGPQGTLARLPGRWSPALRGSYLATAGADGIHVVRWLDDPTNDVRAVTGRVSLPALDWPWLAYRLVRADGTKRVVLLNLRTGRRRRIGWAGSRSQVGRLTIYGGRVAWHVVRPHGSRIVLYTRWNGRTRSFAATHLWALTNPAVTRWRLLWVETRSGVAYVRVHRFGGRTHTVATLWGRTYAYWTTGIWRGIAYVTRWSVASGAAGIVKIRL